MAQNRGLTEVEVASSTEIAGGHTGMTAGCGVIHTGVSYCFSTCLPGAPLFTIVRLSGCLVRALVFDMVQKSLTGGRGSSQCKAQHFLCGSGPAVRS
jgi:hypothetical protein